MPRGFTLLEMLVVVLLIVLITAIVGPLAVSEIGRASMKEAERQVEAAAMLARADAQRRGAVVQLLARPGDELHGIGVELVSIDLTNQNGRAVRSDESGFDDALRSGTTASGQAEVSAEQNAGAREHDAGVDTTGTKEKAILTLPFGVWLIAALPVASDSGDESSLDAPTGARSPVVRTTVESDSSRVLVSLCVFFPDGQIVASTPRYLLSRSGRAVSIQINRWTGRVTATPVEPPRTTEDGSGEQDATSKAAKSKEPTAFAPEAGGVE